MKRRDFLRSAGATTLVSALPASLSAAPDPPTSEERTYTIPLGIGMEEYPYPYPVQYLPLTIGDRLHRMAYMDVPSSAGGADARAVLLLHGKNFWGEYWHETIYQLTHAGYRVIVPDQIGFGKSAKPDDITYSFDLLAANTRQLLDALGIRDIAVVGHSMGGMLAIHFAATYPERTRQLILENPIGLEDYRLQGVLPRTTADLIQDELGQTTEKIRAYRKTYFTQWLPSYERFVEVPARILLSGEFPRYARSAALTSQMIYQQPVVHELPLVRAPALLVIGQSDRTAIGRDRVADAAVRDRLGNYPQLGKATAKALSKARLVEAPNCGHIPHIEAPDIFHRALLTFLRQGDAA